MSDVIQLLPDSVANQIAAGEVIQRPASVIKELVENAIDAGAHNIKVIVVDAGKTSIQVVDDGYGMSDTDARLSFERHSTSKIRKADDLFALHTMGFRGEALASIAAVAKVELKTCLDGNDIGTRVVLAGSKVLEQEPVSCPTGSTFTVESLFFNVPARRRFLKSNATELNNIMTSFERIVLVYPGISFSLYSNGTELQSLPAGNIHKRISDVFGKRFNQDLLPINVDTSMCRITGFVGKPEAARKRGAYEYFFVNGRYMKHPYFHKAVQTAFDRLVPSGMHIPYFIYFDMNPSDIDVNIHPTKTEIKFENEQAVWQILLAAVRDAIGTFCEVDMIDFDTQGKPDIPVFDASRQVKQPEMPHDKSYNPFDHGERRATVPDKWETLYGAPVKLDAPEQTSIFDGNGEASGDVNKDGVAPEEDRSPAHYQYKGMYIMTAVKSGLMIIDQHRADVRIKYEKYLAGIVAGRSQSSQRLLFPEIAHFSPSQAVMLGKLLPELSKMGFDIADMGHGSYAVNAVPAGIEGMDYSSLLDNMISDAGENVGGAVDEIDRALALSMARRAALPQGQVLDNAGMEDIVNRLFACPNVNYTPDGKRILCILPQREIDNLLG